MRPCGNSTTRSTLSRPRKRLDRGAAGIARGRDHDGGALAALGQHVVHQPREQLHRDVLERQRRAVEQLEHELIGPDLNERHHRGMAERGVGLVRHAAEIGVGNLAGRTAGSPRPRPRHRAGRKSPRWSRQRAAARPRARRGRRRGQARPASHRRNRGRGPRPGWKCSASNHPPKALALCQAFDIDHDLYFANREARSYHKTFWGQGEMAGRRKNGVTSHAEMRSGASLEGIHSRTAASSGEGEERKRLSPRHCERSEAKFFFGAARWIASLRSQ